MKHPKSKDLLHVVCLVHLVICLAFISVCTDHEVDLGGVVVSTTLQWAYATFCCFCIVGIIVADIGVVYDIAIHLDVYYYVLMLSALLDLGWIAIFIIYGHECRTVRFGRMPSAPSLMTVVSCSLNSILVLVCLVILITFKVFGMATAARGAQDSRLQQQEDLLPYLSKSMAAAPPPPTYPTFQFGHDATLPPATMPPVPQAGMDPHRAPPSMPPDQGFMDPQQPPQRGTGRETPPLSFRSAPPPPQQQRAASGEAPTMAPNSQSEGPLMSSYANYGSTDSGADPSFSGPPRSSIAEPPGSSIPPPTPARQGSQQGSLSGKPPRIPPAVPRLSLQSCGANSSPVRRSYSSAAFGNTPDSVAASSSIATGLEDNTPQDPPLAI